MPSNYPVYCLITGDHLLAGISLGRFPPSSGFSAPAREQAGLLGSGVQPCRTAPPQSPSRYHSLPCSWPCTKPSASAFTNDYLGWVGRTRTTSSPLTVAHLLIPDSITMAMAPSGVSLASDHPPRFFLIQRLGSKGPSGVL